MRKQNEIAEEWEEFEPSVSQILQFAEGYDEVGSRSYPAGDGKDVEWNQVPSRELEEIYDSFENMYDVVKAQRTDDRVRVVGIPLERDVTDTKEWNPGEAARYWEISADELFGETVGAEKERRPASD